MITDDKLIEQISAELNTCYTEDARKECIKSWLNHAYLIGEIHGAKKIRDIVINESFKITTI